VGVLFHPLGAHGIFYSREVSPDFSELFRSAENGDSSASDALFSALYAELRRVARRELARRGLPISLGATTLVHQTYIEMAAKNGADFPQLAAFMSYAARVMRGLIIDYARRRHAVKRGGQFTFTTLDEQIAETADAAELSKVSDALDELARAEPALAEVVDLKFFCGFTFEEIAAMKKVHERTIQRQWEKARIYLHQTIRSELD
jgi:RNA polymerase sigma factor (TIGR02999 family)